MSNIPILIRRTPAATEYLGKNYPLFFDSLDEASSLIEDEIINNAHIYLQKINKRPFMIENFVNEIKRCEFYTSLFR